MESIIDWDEFEEDLTQKAGTKKMWYSIAAIVGILAITFFASQMRFDSREYDGTFGSGWTFDYNTFFLLMLGSVTTVVVTGLKIQAGLSKVISRQKILAAKDKTIDDLNKKIVEKNAELVVLKRQLDDKCITFNANAAALEKAKGAGGVKDEVNTSCQPQPLRIV